MKFLQQSSTPLLTITRRRRKVIIHQTAGVIAVRETETKLELTLPSFFRGIRDTLSRFSSALGDAMASAFLPRVYAL